MKKKLFERIDGNQFKIKESPESTFETTIHHPETNEEIPVTVAYEYMPAERGSREGGAQMEPDSSANVDIYSVKDDHGVEYDLTDADEQRISGEILDQYAD